MIKKMPVRYVAASRERILSGLRGVYGFKPDYPKSRFIAEKLLRETSDRNTQIDCYLALSRISKLEGAINEALEYVDKATDLCTGSRDDTHLLKVRFMMGSIYADFSSEEKLRVALNFLRGTEKLAKKINNKKFLFNIYAEMARVLLKQAKLLRKEGKMEEVANILGESLRLRYTILDLEKEIGALSDMAGTYGGIAAVMQEQGRLDEAIEITQRFCIPLAKKADIRGASFFNLGDFYKEKGELRKGLGYVLMGRAIFEAIEHKKYLAHADNVLQKEFNVAEVLSGIDLSEEEKRVAQKRIIDLKSLDEASKELSMSEEEIKIVEGKIIAKLLS